MRNTKLLPRGKALFALISPADVSVSFAKGRFAVGALKERNDFMSFQEYVALAYPGIDWIAVGYALIAAAMPVLAVFMALHNGVKSLNASRKDDENEQ